MDMFLFSENTKLISLLFNMFCLGTEDTCPFRGAECARVGRGAVWSEGTRQRCGLELAKKGRLTLGKDSEALPM